MARKWMSWAVGGGLLLAAHQAAAERSWSRVLATHRTEADPEKDYTLSENEGPWLIIAASFAGDGAEEQARKLVFELRQRYKMKAYLHDMNFEFKDAEGRGFDTYGEPLKFRYQRDGGKQFAVLVGDFQDSSDDAAQRALKRIKAMTPETVSLKEGGNTNMQLANWRQLAHLATGKETLGPMNSAFLTTNPLLPAEYFNPQGGLDPEVAEWNEAVEYSLLKCPGKYTLQVATFRGNSEIRQNKVRDIEDGKSQMKSSLENATIKAHKMTLALRAKGYEAYEFHDRYASIVTVGSFSSAGSPRPDGKTEINPEIHKLMKRFGSTNQKDGAEAGHQEAASVLLPKTILKIPFDMSPIPIYVPRVSLSQAYGRR